jgi:hypothetical protein
MAIIGGVAVIGRVTWASMAVLITATGIQVKVFMVVSGTAMSIGTTRQ